MTNNLDPGTTLAATEALRSRRGRPWTDEQVAYLVALAYDTGRRHALAADLAETVACWQENHTPAQTREQRVAARLADMERRSGPPTYRGGPVDWETGLPLRVLEAVA